MDSIHIEGYHRVLTERQHDAMVRVFRFIRGWLR